MMAIGKVVLGLVSSIPFVFFILFFFWLIPAFFVHQPEGQEESLFSQRFDALVPLAIATSVVLIALTAVYAIILARRPAVSLGEKIAIPIAVIFTNGLILPFVFWVYVWRGRGSGQHAPPLAAPESDRRVPR